MSNYFTPVLVYGFNIGDQEFMIEYRCLEDKFPFVRIYADYVQNNNLYEAIYGIECEIDQDTADIVICHEHYNEVRYLLDEYINYLRKNYDQKEFLEKKKNISLCYRMAIEGNYNINKKSIYLEYSDEEDEDEDKDDKDEEEEKI